VAKDYLKPKRDRLPARLSFAVHMHLKLRPEWTQGGFAQELGCKPTHLSDWMKGSRSVPEEKCRALSKILDVDHAWLVDGECGLHPRHRSPHALLPSIMVFVRAIRAMYLAQWYHGAFFGSADPSSGLVLQDPMAGMYPTTGEPLDRWLASAKQMTGSVLPEIDAACLEYAYPLIAEAYSKQAELFLRHTGEQASAVKRAEATSVPSPPLTGTFWGIPPQDMGMKRLREIVSQVRWDPFVQVRTKDEGEL